MSSRQRQLLLIASGVMVVTLALAVSFFYPWTDIPYFGIDFTIFLSAARTLSAGGNPYVLTELRQFAPPGGVSEFLVYAYPPLLAQLLLPLSIFPLETATRLWLALNLAGVIGSVILLLNAVRWRPRPLALAGLVLGAVLFLPNLYTYLSGQASIWVLIWASIGVWFMRQDAPVKGGIAWALAWVKPHPVPLLPVLFIRYRRGVALFGAILAASLLSVVTYVPSWIRVTLEAAEANAAAGELLYQAAFLGIFSRSGTIGWVVRGGAVLAAMCILFWLILTGRDWKAIEVACFTLGLVASPYLSRSDVAISLIPIILILSDWQRSQGPAVLALAAWAIPLVCIGLYVLTPLNWALLPLVWGSGVQVVLAGSMVWYVAQRSKDPIDLVDMVST